MLTALTRDRGRLEAIEEFCDLCGEAEAQRRGWPRHDGVVSSSKGWTTQVRWRRRQSPGCCQVCGVGRQAQQPWSAA